MTLGWFLYLSEPVIHLENESRILLMSTSTTSLQETVICTSDLRKLERRKDEWLGQVMWVSGASSQAVKAQKVPRWYGGMPMNRLAGPYFRNIRQQIRDSVS